MVEFGARLTLKDNMSATIKKNIDMQKKMTKQVDDTSSGLKKLGKIVAKPVIALKDKATAGIEKIKNALSGITKGATIGIGLVGAGATALLGGAISQGASLEQSIGGVETLYKGKMGSGGAVDTVIANANKAYKTAGISANAYMETVTSFSASLLNSLGGDTAKSAQIADMAIIDMADNANKFGTDMESIQNAYQGFAKQNYTMLDNLKLGYGGTQEEMQRLLNDAQKISGVKYDMSNLADVYSAINVIQTELGVAGATAKEAEQTFSGSFSAMKASFSNLLGAMATGGDIEGTMAELVSSASTFLFNNAIPMIGRVLKALPTAVKTGIQNALPEIREHSKEIITGIKEGLEGTPLAGVFSGLSEKFSGFVAVIKDHMGLFKNIFEVAMPAVSAVFSTAWTIISPIIDFAITVFDNLLSCVETAFPTIQSIIEGVWNVLSGIFEGIAGGISKINDAISSLDVGGKLGGAINWIGGKLGFAYGKDRVPYNNYPAILHEGEKVLTRNQADQYERAMTERGTAPVTTGSSNSGTNVSIEKLADTVIIEKDADVDKVMAQMMAKFRKLVPNMA